MPSPRRYSPPRRVVVAVVVVGIAGLTLAHFTASVHDQGVHAILFKATLVPLVLAGLWFGIRGAALPGVVTVEVTVGQHRSAPRKGAAYRVIVEDVDIMLRLPRASFPPNELSNRRTVERDK